MSFNLPVNPRISFRGFRRRGEYNRDGWGLTFYPDESAQIFKEPLKAGESALSEFLKNYTEIKSKMCAYCQELYGSKY
jgi:glutamine amidotransferase